MARDLLSGICQPEEVKGICEIILQHAQRERANECTVETRIVQDADLLDHVAPIGLWLAFYWIATHGERIDDLLRYLHSEESSRHLTWMRNALNFDISVDIFDQRAEHGRQFFADSGRVQREGL
jgi:uncharacterized protein